MTRPHSLSDALRFALLFSVLYLAFGVASPFLPAFLSSRGLAPEQVGVVLSLGTAVRLLSGPASGRIADRLHALRVVLAVCAGTAGALALGILPAYGFLPLLAATVLQAAALAPTTLLADALAVTASVQRGASHPGFEYGWVRAAGSAAFIIGSLASGQVIAAFGLTSILVWQAAFLVMTAAAALLVPELSSAHQQTSRSLPQPGPLALIRMPAFRRLVLIAALVLGSHAMHDAFAIIWWNTSGISPAVASVLWSESVAAEVIVFLGFGPLLLRYITPESAMLVAAVAAVLRWTVMAQTTDVAALAVVEPLHGLTFALLHLSCMRILAVLVPNALAATAQALYGTVAIGAASAVLTLLSGSLYAHFGAGGFWAMAILAALAIPMIWTMPRSRTALVQ